METSFKKLAVELELSESVVFTGLLDNPSKIIAQSALLVLPSETEGFGLPVLEALAIGTPVVATRCGSIMEEVLPFENCGQLVPINDVEALSNAIVLELELNRRVTLSENTLALFSPENVAKKIEQLA
jgi:glycosyltransferase involved in cell wall biosynthesis